MIWLQQKYLMMLPLEGFQNKGGKFNFRCPVCGDSQKTKSKKRGWASPYKGNMRVSCFNCGYNGSFDYFLKTMFPAFYSDYKLEKIKELGYNTKQQEIIESNVEEVFDVGLSHIPFQSIYDLPDNHRAKMELERRLIPEKYYSDLYYTDDYTAWCIENDYIEDKDQKPNDARIVIPVRNKFGKIIGMTGRTINKRLPKYLHTKFEDEDLIYGIENVNPDKKILVVEGALDSMFLPNSVAVSGAVSKIHNLSKHFIKEQLIIIADNEKRNRYTCDFMLQLLKDEFVVFIPPTNYIHKDINDAIISGMTQKQVCKIISQNLYSGLKGIAKLQMWRKC